MGLYDFFYVLYKPIGIHVRLELVGIHACGEQRVIRHVCRLNGIFGRGLAVSPRVFGDLSGFLRPGCFVELGDFFEQCFFLLYKLFV